MITDINIFSSVPGGSGRDWLHHSWCVAGCRFGKSGYLLFMRRKARHLVEFGPDQQGTEPDLHRMMIDTLFMTITNAPTSITKLGSESD